MGGRDRSAAPKQQISLLLYRNYVFTHLHFDYTDINGDPKRFVLEFQHVDARIPQAFGLISASPHQVVYLEPSLVVCTALENIAVFSLRTGTLATLIAPPQPPSSSSSTAADSLPQVSNDHRLRELEHEREEGDVLASTLPPCFFWFHFVFFNQKNNKSLHVAMAQVTALARYEPETDKGGLSIIAGYSDGAVRIWDVGTYQMKAEVPTASQKGVSAIATCNEEHVVLAGTKDGKIIVWDTIGDVIQWRLKGHRGEITGLALVSTSQVIAIMLIWMFMTRHSRRKGEEEKTLCVYVCER